MCTIQNYLHSREKEIELRLNGYQTSLLEVELLENNNGFYKYKLKESCRTNAKFDDILTLLNGCYKKGFRCYQVPEHDVPKAKLEPKNLLDITRLEIKTDPKTKDKLAFIWLPTRIDDGHLLCVPPSTIQIAAQIAAMEHISGIQGNLDLLARQEVDSFEKSFSFPEQVPSALAQLLRPKDLELPSFEVEELPEEEYVILKDNERPGNSEQRKFVCNALSTPDFTIKMGPPGSGKTTSIVELLIQLVKRGKRVLLVASTNVAIDNILEKLAKNMDLVSVKRYGSDDNDNISIEAKNFIVGKNFGKTEAKALLKRLKAIPQDKLNKAQQHFIDFPQYSENSLLYEILEENAPIVAGTTFGAALPEMKKLAMKGESEPPFDYMVLDEASKTTIQEFLVPAALCKHWIIVGDIKQLPPYVNDDDLAENLQICYPEDPNSAREYTAASDSLLAASGKDSRQTVILVEKISEMDAFLYKKYAKMNSVLYADADKPQDKELLPYATIIVGSKDSFKDNRDVLSPRITTVRPACDTKTGRILHEEEMQEWISVARYNRERLFKRYDENAPKEWHNEISWRLIRMFEQRDNIVNADHSTLERLKMQIEEQIPENDRERCNKALRIFEQIYLPSCMELFIRGYGKYRDLALFRGFPQEMLEKRYIELTYQHRCHQEIAQYASDEFYGGKAMRSEHMKNTPEWTYTHYGEKHVHWEDIKGFCDSKNRNGAEQKWIEGELKAFLKYAKSHQKKEKWSVAVLSFYKEQADELKKICKRIFNGSDRFVAYSAGSVDSFQGHEADIVFLSYGNQHPTCFIEAPNRLNVAITRARYMMVHVGNWRAMSKGQGALGRIVQKIKPSTRKH